MKIGLIAPQDNGKTSYLVALYAVVVHDLSGRKGYPLRFSVPNPRHERWLDDSFTNLVNEELPLRNGEDPHGQRFPRKTSDEVTAYEFEIIERETSFSQRVSLVDFPGEAMRGVSSDGQADIHSEMLDQLTDCDAFIVLLDAESLMSRKPWASKSRLNPAKIEEIILKSIARSPHRRFSKIGVPIAFCMSMADKVASLFVGDEEAQASGYERILALFPSFFQASHQHPVLITAVSLGETIGQNSNGDRDKGGPFEPFLIEKPFQFCVAFGALSGMTNARETERSWDSTADGYDSNHKRAKSLDVVETVLDWFRSGASIGQTPQDKWAERRNTVRGLARSSGAEAEKFKSIVSFFVDQLRTSEDAAHYSIYLGGELQELSAEIEPGSLPLEPLR